MRRFPLKHSLMAGAAAFTFGCAVILTLAYSSPSTRDDGGLWGTLIARFGPFLIATAVLMGVYVLVVWATGPVVVDLDGITAPFSPVAKRSFTWRSLSRVVVRADGKSNSVMVLEPIDGRRRVVRLATVKDADGLVQYVAEIAAGLLRDERP